MTALATNQRSAGPVSTNHSSPRLALAHAAAHPRHQPPQLGQADQTVSVAVKQLERLQVKTENTIATILLFALTSLSSSSSNNIVFSSVIMFPSSLIAIPFCLVEQAFSLTSIFSSLSAMAQSQLITDVSILYALVFAVWLSYCYVGDIEMLALCLLSYDSTQHTAYRHNSLLCGSFLYQDFILTLAFHTESTLHPHINLLGQELHKESISAATRDTLHKCNRRFASVALSGK